MIGDPIEHIESLTKRTNDYMGTRVQSSLSRYPLTFSLLSVFGIVSILHGFESAISYIPYLSERPFLIFILGLLILIFTGTLYRGLEKKRLD